MRRLDELHLDYPFAGSRMLRDLLRREGVSIGRRHVAIGQIWEVYLRAYDSVAEARASIASYLTFYNERRPPTPALDRRTPDEAYFGARIIAAAA